MPTRCDFSCPTNKTHTTTRFLPETIPFPLLRVGRGWEGVLQLYVELQVTLHKNKILYNRHKGVFVVNNINFGIVSLSLRENMLRRQKQ